MNDPVSRKANQDCAELGWVPENYARPYTIKDLENKSSRGKKKKTTKK